MVSFFKLLKFSTPKEKFIMTIGSVAAFISGANLPIKTLLLGEMIDSFGL